MKVLCRQKMLSLISVSLVLMVWGPVIGAASEMPVHGRALSLRLLQERAQLCQETGDCDPPILHLAHLRRIDGYVIDRENKDLVLIGQVDPSWPALHLEDLVVALRDAWRLYATRKGNVLYVSNPGVSIDPQPRVIRELQRIGERMDGLGRSAQMEEVLEAWHQVCHQPQTVRVMGIPFQSHFASVMLQVDYHLKRLADASESLDIEGFTSLSEMHLDAAWQAVQEGKTGSIALSTMSRFWFYPKELKVKADHGAAFIDTEFGLMVLTEEERLNAEGQIVGRGAEEPLAGEWARLMTDLFPAIAAVRPKWRQLENLAWLVALARTIHYRGALETAELDAGWLFNDYRVPATDVPETVPGCSNVKTLDYRQAVEGGYLVGALTLPSCGGVEMDIRVDEDAFLADKAGALRRTGRAALTARTDRRALFWDF